MQATLPCVVQAEIHVIACDVGGDVVMKSDDSLRVKPKGYVRGQ